MKNKYKKWFFFFLIQKSYGSDLRIKFNNPESSIKKALFYLKIRFFFLQFSRFFKIRILQVPWNVLWALEYLHSLGTYGYPFYFISTRFKSC